MTRVNLSDAEVVMLLPPIATMRARMERIANRYEKQGKLQHAADFRARSAKLFDLWEKIRKGEQNYGDR